MMYLFLRFKPQQPVGVTHYGNRRERHCRSGKIMRRILRKIAAGDTSNLGDTSTLADPGVVEKLLEEKQAIAMPS